MKRLPLVLTAVTLFAVTLAVAVQPLEASGPATTPSVSSTRVLTFSKGPALLSSGKRATSSSTRHGWHTQAANDGRLKTRWVASNGGYPQWWRVDLGKVYDLSSIKIVWYRASQRGYRFSVSASRDAQARAPLIDRLSTPARGVTAQAVSTEARYVTITVTGAEQGWASIKEVRIYGKKPTKPSGKPTPTPTPSPTPTPTPSATAPAVTPTPTPTPTPTVTSTPLPGGGTVTVSGTSSSAVDAAFASATSGDTVYFPAGVYTHTGRVVIPDGVSVRGAGIYRPSDGSGTWLQFAVKWGSGLTIEDLRVGGAGSMFYPVSRGTSNATEQRLCPDTAANGSHDVTFRFVRFRGGSNLINLGGYSNDWTAPVNRTDCYRTRWYDCEFERGNEMTNAVLNSASHSGEGNMFNIWVDCRAGGSRIFDLTWERCHFGVKNGVTTSSGDADTAGVPPQPDGYGCGRMGILLQPAPTEKAGNGPRSNLSTFDWTQLDHTYPGPYVVKDCVFEYSWDYTINPCDQSRAYSMSMCARLGHCDDTGQNWTHPGGTSSNCPDGWGNATGWRWTELPDRFWLIGMSITDNIFKGNVPGGGLSSGSVVVGEQMRDSLSAFNTSGLGALTSPHDGRFGNVNHDNTVNTGATAYAPSPYDP